MVAAVHGVQNRVPVNIAPTVVVFRRENESNLI
jgi:hypothetical protein